MCHFLYLASPLTLSEVRSMLPAALAADPLAPAPAHAFRKLLPGLQAAARLLVGACSCDLFLQRDPDHHREEAALRRRYRELGLDRNATIRAIDRHRSGEHPILTVAAWQSILVAFIAEHARNAGKTLFYREFSPAGLVGNGLSLSPVPIALHAVREQPGGWLDEAVPTVVGRQSSVVSRPTAAD